MFIDTVSPPRHDYKDETPLKLIEISVSTIGNHIALTLALPLQQRPAVMTDTESANQNQIHQSLVPILRVWTRCIGWTVLLSALLAVLFALAVDGCASIR